MRTHLTPNAPDENLTHFDKRLLALQLEAEAQLAHELAAEHIDFETGPALLDFRRDAYAYLDAMSRQHERPANHIAESEDEWARFFADRCRIIREQVRDEALARWVRAKTHANRNIQQWREDRLVRHQGQLPLPTGSGSRGDLLSALGIGRLSDDAKRLTRFVKQTIISQEPEPETDQPQPPQQVRRTVPAPTLNDPYDDGY